MEKRICGFCCAIQLQKIYTGAVISLTGRMKKVLVTGGNGFLGSYFVERALSSGMEVTVVDDMTTSDQRKVPEEAVFIKESIENYYDKGTYDYVVHLAARPSPEDYISNPVSTLMSNSLGTLRALDIAKENNAVFMYTSSSEVYGNAQIIPTPETYFGYVNPNGIRSCYDESKRFSEALIMAYHRQFALDTRIQRPFNVYGPRIREDGLYGRVIPRFIDQALKGEDITVHGDGNQTRSFLYIEDWLEGTWRLLTRDGLGGVVLNIGASQEVTVMELAILIKEMTKSPSKTISINPRDEDPRRRSANLELAHKLLSWKPEHSLSDGLSQTIKWFREKMR